MVELLLLLVGDRDPPGAAVVVLTSLDKALLNPVVDEVDADPEAIR